MLSITMYFLCIGSLLRCLCSCIVCLVVVVRCLWVANLCWLDWCSHPHVLPACGNQSSSCNVTENRACNHFIHVPSCACWCFCWCAQPTVSFLKQRRRHQCGEFNKYSCFKHDPYWSLGKWVLWHVRDIFMCVRSVMRLQLWALRTIASPVPMARWKQRKMCEECVIWQGRLKAGCCCYNYLLRQLPLPTTDYIKLLFATSYNY